VGDDYNTFRNFTITNAMPDDTIVNVYGIELVPASSFNTFENFRIEGVYQGVTGYDHPDYRIGDTQQMVSVGNTFNNFEFSRCYENVELNGAKNQRNKFAYQAPTAENSPFVSSAAVVSGKTVLTIGNSASLAYRNAVGFYNAKYLQFFNDDLTASSATPNIVQIESSTITPSFTFTINGTFTTAPTNNKFAVIDYLNAAGTGQLVSMNPIRNWTFMNCKFMNNTNSKCCENRFGSNISYLDNYFFNNHTTASATTTNFIQDVESVGNFIFTNNLVDNCKRGFGLSNVSTAFIVNNRVINMNPTTNNWIHDYQNNSALTVMRNDAYGQTADANGYTGLKHQLHSSSTYITPPLLTLSGRHASTLDITAVGTYYGKLAVNVEGVGTKFVSLFN
jgi:hypothetical protein